MARSHDRSQNYTIAMSVLMQTSYVPPPFINDTLAQNISRGKTFTLVCSVTVDFGVIVDLSWTTPNGKAKSQGRLMAPEQISRNLSLGGTQLKRVEQVMSRHIHI